MTYYGGKELADSFRTVRKNTLAIAEEIPEAQFDFRAVPEVRSVAEMLSHIAVSASRNYGDARGPPRNNVRGFRLECLHGRSGSRKSSGCVRSRRFSTRSVERAKSGPVGSKACRRTSCPRKFASHLRPLPPARAALSCCSLPRSMRCTTERNLMLIQRLLGMVPHLTREREKMRETLVRAQTN